MLKVRFARFGAKKRPYYHIVVVDARFPRDGRFIEQVGTYDPVKPMAEARFKSDRLSHWLELGAQPTTSVAKVIREHQKATQGQPAGQA